MTDTDLDALEPQWKYLCWFAIQKGQPKTRSTGPLGDLLAPRRVPTTAPPLATTTEDLTTQLQQPIVNQDTGDVKPDDTVSPERLNRRPLKRLRTATSDRLEADGWSRIHPGTTKA